MFVYHTLIYIIKFSLMRSCNLDFDEWMLLVNMYICMQTLLINMKSCEIEQFCQNNKSTRQRKIYESTGNNIIPQLKIRTKNTLLLDDEKNKSPLFCWKKKTNVTKKGPSNVSEKKSLLPHLSINQIPTTRTQTIILSIKHDSEVNVLLASFIEIIFIFCLDSYAHIEIFQNPGGNFIIVIALTWASMCMVKFDFVFLILSTCDHELKGIFVLTSTMLMVMLMLIEKTILRETMHSQQ